MFEPIIQYEFQGAQDNEAALTAQVKKDFNLPNDEYGEAAAIAIAHCLREGFGEMEPLIQKYINAGLLCLWDGRPHSSAECSRRYAEFLQGQKDYDDMKTRDLVR